MSAASRVLGVAAGVELVFALGGWTLAAGLAFTIGLLAVLR